MQNKRPSIFSDGWKQKRGPFIKRYYSLDQTVKIRQNGRIPRLIGRHEDWKSFIEDAVSENTRPSRELISANFRLAAWEAHLGIGQVSSFPISFSAAFTDICNARCNFCA